MAKKRSRKSGGDDAKTSRHNKTDSGVRSAIRTYDDVAESDEDEFDRAQDKILLDGARRDARMRGRGDDDAEMSDEEVMRIAEADSDEDADDVEELEEDDDDLDPDQIELRDSRNKAADLENWGDSKREYYNADELTEEADLKAEEEEARRIQKQNLAKLDASAFVNDLDAWKDDVADSDEEGDDGQDAQLASLSEEAIASMSQEEKLQLLHARHPEFEPLSGEVVRLTPILTSLQALATKRPRHPQITLVNLKIDAVRSYLAVLAFYFYYLTQPQAKAMPVKEHEMMITLVQCREAWNRVADLVVDVEELSDVESIASVQPTATKAVAAAKAVEVASKKRKRSAKEIVPASKKVSFAPTTSSAKLDLNLDSDDDIDDAVRAFSAVKDRRTSKSATTIGKNRSDRGDAQADAIDAADAAASRKSLRFHAAKIASKAGKRQRHATQSGDMDVPYRERRKERELRLAAEAEARLGKAGTSEALGMGGDDLDNVDTVPRTAATGGGNDGDSAYDDNDYYNTVANAAKARKVQKKADHDAEVAAVRAARAGYAIETIDGTLSADGKRAIDRTIAANKGLTPRRAKENRNARVKKRKRYEAAQKKVGSQKAVFKGGLAGRSYGGESTGINSKVVKSVRLDQGDARRR